MYMYLYSRTTQQNWRGLKWVIRKRVTAQIGNTDTQVRLYDLSRNGYGDPYLYMWAVQQKVEGASAINSPLCHVCALCEQTKEPGYLLLISSRGEIRPLSRFQFLPLPTMEMTHQMNNETEGSVTFAGSNPDDKSILQNILFRACCCCCCSRTRVHDMRIWSTVHMAPSLKGKKAVVFSSPVTKW